MEIATAPPDGYALTPGKVYVFLVKREVVTQQAGAHLIQRLKRAGITALMMYVYGDVREAVALIGPQEVPAAAPTPPAREADRGETCRFCKGTKYLRVDGQFGACGHCLGTGKNWSPAPPPEPPAREEPPAPPALEPPHLTEGEIAGITGRSLLAVPDVDQVLGDLCVSIDIARDHNWPEQVAVLQDARRLILHQAVLLSAAAPHICPECGQHVKIDEDGCCVMCGADTVAAAAVEVGVVMPGSVEYRRPAPTAEAETSLGLTRYKTGSYGAMTKDEDGRWCDFEDAQAAIDYWYVRANRLEAESKTLAAKLKRLTR